MRSRLLHTLATWWASPSQPSASRLGLALTLALHIAAALGGLAFAWEKIRPLRTAPAPPALSDRVQDGGVRFGMDETTRRAVFAAVAREEPAARRRAGTDFPRHAWSQEDDRGALERNQVEGVAAARRLSLSKVYLVLDEGIRAHWPAPDGAPLRPTVAPLDLRHQ